MWDFLPCFINRCTHRSRDKERLIQLYRYNCCLSFQNDKEKSSCAIIFEYFYPNIFLKSRFEFKMIRIETVDVNAYSDIQKRTPIAF